VVGAVVIVGSSGEGGAERQLSSSTMQFEHGCLACIELLGRTVLGRTIEELLRGRIDSVAVIASSPFASAVIGHEQVGFFTVHDVWQKAWEKAKSFSAEAVVVVRLGAYVEFDPADLLQFHRDQGKAVTRAWSDDGSLDVWVVDAEIFAQNDGLVSCLESEDPARYFVPGYVNRLESARDLRQLITDGLGARCHFRPQGTEIRPGIWLGHGAEVDRTARLVAPVYIGRASKIADQCLITRGSNVESNAKVDYGTVIEDSTVLSNTYVGIGLDLSHSIVDGDNLLHLQHGVSLKISDPVVLRPIRDNRVRSGVDGSFLASLKVRNVAMSSMPKKGE
jgi:hypothetical protein